MIELQSIKNIYFKDYKSYRKFEDIFIPQICNFNVIIGKNNTGKTSFIDIIEFMISPKNFVKKYSVMPSIFYDVILDGPHIEKGFSRHVSGGSVPGTHYTYASQFINKYITVGLEGSQFIGRISFNDEMIRRQDYWKKVIASYENELRPYTIIRLSAERDIKPEKGSRELSLNSYGVGATNLVRGFINEIGKDEHIIEDNLLKHLNIIMGNDATFSRIQVQQNYNIDNSSTWEIFLEEKDSGRFALSKSGSGLKTIILVLLNLLVLPKLPEYKDKHLIYAFEELENNLHPALQRRLFDYLYKFSSSTRIPVFLTTHSHVAIDMFCSKLESQVLHVTKENHESRIKKVDNFFDKQAILEDLAVKASDLFQSNGIIWVEGPSDRIYINKWLEVFCNSKYQEGKDFQYLYYGGRLLSHYSLDDLNNKINILTTNRNSAIIIDSDKKKNTDKINDTKKRVNKEFSDKKLFCWITAGKEIENYLPKEAIFKIANHAVHQCKRYQPFSKYIKNVGVNFENTKVPFATKVKEYITKENSEKILDLKNQIEELYKQIEEWNKID